MEYEKELIKDLNLFRELYSQELEKNDTYVVLLNNLENKLNTVMKSNIELKLQLKELKKYKKMFFEQKKIVVNLTKSK